MSDKVFIVLRDAGWGPVVEVYDDEWAVPNSLRDTSAFVLALSKVDARTISQDLATAVAAL